MLKEGTGILGGIQKNSPNIWKIVRIDKAITEVNLAIDINSNKRKTRENVFLSGRI